MPRRVYSLAQHSHSQSVLLRMVHIYCDPSPAAMPFAVLDRVACLTHIVPTVRQHLHIFRELP
jgi:hypothetical protein